MPKTKNAAGYFSGAGMDLIDLFIGSEGTLAAIVEAEVYLLPSPELQFSVMFFLDSEAAAIDLVRSLRSSKDADITAIEYFDPGSLALLRDRRERMKAASMVPPGLPDSKAAAAIYVDVSSAKAKAASDAALLKKLSSFLPSGRVIGTFAAFDKDERERFRKFRHALPETVNTIISGRKRQFPKLTKLGTDMAVPDERLSDIMAVYRKALDARGLDYVIFGHIGDNHVHVNILPRDMDEYAAGKEIYASFAKAVLSMNGSISAEHGIGRLKTGFLQLMMGDSGIEQMRRLKAAFDPASLFGRGVLFPFRSA
jgi:D-lactate dehydrogenase (cytochrome)